MKTLDESIIRVREISGMLEAAMDLGGAAQALAALEWVRDRGGLDAVRERRRESIPRAAYERKKAGWLAHIRECETALAKRSLRIRELEKGLEGTLRRTAELECTCVEFKARRTKLADENDTLRNELADIRGRLMPEGMSWPFYEDGEPVRLGEHWQQDEYDWSITSIDSIEFAEDGVRFENEYADAFYRYGERVKRPAPPVLDADGVEIHKGDTVWVASNGMGPYIVDRLPIPGETDVLRLVDETGTCWSDSGFGYIASQLTHERPDSWQRLWLDMHPADETECVGLDRDEFVRRAKKLAGVSE